MATKASVPAIVVLLTVLDAGCYPAAYSRNRCSRSSTEGQSILVVDKLFENFSFSVAGAGAYIANPAAIDVAAISIGDEIGNRFAGLLAARSNLVPDSAVAVTIGYDVTVVDPNLWIHDISLFFNGMVTDPAGYARVAETVYYENTPVGSASVTTPSPLNDHDLFDAAFKKLHVEKTIELYGGARGFTTISFIDQTSSRRFLSLRRWPCAAWRCPC
jgi:hypothetical protein